jgi:hypothetical protein
MIQRLQKLFHTDKWWGKTVFIIVMHVFYWSVVVSFFRLFPNDFFDQNYDLGTLIFLAYIFLFIPFSVFFISKFVLLVLKINKILIYILNFTLILLTFFFIILLSLSTMQPNFF